MPWPHCWSSPSDSSSVCVLLAMLFCAVRLLVGPTAQDRVLALDTLWMCAMLLALVLGIRYGSHDLFRSRDADRADRLRVDHRAGQVPDARGDHRMNAPRASPPGRPCRSPLLLVLGGSHHPDRRAGPAAPAQFLPAHPRAGDHDHAGRGLHPDRVDALFHRAAVAPRDP